MVTPGPTEQPKLSPQELADLSLPNWAWDFQMSQIENYANLPHALDGTEQPVETPQSNRIIQVALSIGKSLAKSSLAYAMGFKYRKN